jgi:hypothetical protein
LLYKIKQRELKSERAREEAREAIESATLQSHPAPVREGLLELENSFGGAPSSVHATQHRHYSRVRRAKAYRMLASLGHLGVAALATLEISLDQQNLAQTCTAAAQIVRALKFAKQASQFILPPCSSFREQPQVVQRAGVGSVLHLRRLRSLVLELAPFASKTCYVNE